MAATVINKSTLNPTDYIKSESFSAAISAVMATVKHYETIVNMSPRDAYYQGELAKHRIALQDMQDARTAAFMGAI